MIIKNNDIVYTLAIYCNNKDISWQLKLKFVLHSIQLQDLLLWTNNFVIPKIYKIKKLYLNIQSKTYCSTSWFKNVFLKVSSSFSFLIEESSSVFFFSLISASAFPLPSSSKLSLKETSSFSSRNFWWSKKNVN